MSIILLMFYLISGCKDRQFYQYYRINYGYILLKNLQISYFKEPATTVSIRPLSRYLAAIFCNISGVMLSTAAL